MRTTPAAEPGRVPPARPVTPLADPHIQRSIDDMSAQRSVFWDDLARDLQGRRFRIAYRRTALRIAAVDLAVNVARGLSRRQGREG
jgi:hypothetical protein